MACSTFPADNVEVTIDELLVTPEIQELLATETLDSTRDEVASATASIVNYNNNGSPTGKLDSDKNELTQSKEIEWTIKDKKGQEEEKAVAGRISPAYIDSKNCKQKQETTLRPNSEERQDLTQHKTPLM
ncbi:unnamed protein product [Peronospora belbahrii]|uniref:Uncharacterized protein n=1 Tax=Peronospora belbahrii TaxID=622444 RepID=A0ABN8D9C1_9STRA|nr:unnamed protein product [Peronospora belbahrii]